MNRKLSAASITRGIKNELATAHVQCQVIAVRTRLVRTGTWQTFVITTEGAETAAITAALARPGREVRVSTRFINVITYTTR